MKHSTTYPRIAHAVDIAQGLAEHERLVHWMVRREWLESLSYTEALQAGRIALCGVLRGTIPREAQPSPPTLCLLSNESYGGLLPKRNHSPRSFSPLTHPKRVLTWTMQWKARSCGKRCQEFCGWVTSGSTRRMASREYEVDDGSQGRIFRNFFALVWSW